MVLDFLIGEGFGVTGFAFEDDGGLVGAVAFSMAVDAVVGGVQLSAEEPLGVGRVEFHRGVPFLEPVQLVCPAFPPLDRVVVRLVIDRGVVGVRLGLELGGRLERAFFVKQRLDGF